MCGAVCSWLKVLAVVQATHTIPLYCVPGCWIVRTRRAWNRASGLAVAEEATRFRLTPGAGRVSSGQRQNVSNWRYHQLETLQDAIKKMQGSFQDVFQGADITELLLPKFILPDQDCTSKTIQSLVRRSTIRVTTHIFGVHHDPIQSQHISPRNHASKVISLAEVLCSQPCSGTGAD